MMEQDEDIRLQLIRENADEISRRVPYKKYATVWLRDVKIQDISNADGGYVYTFNRVMGGTIEEHEGVLGEPKSGKKGSLGIYELYHPC